MSAPKPVALCILDGWGLRSEQTANAPALANTPNFDKIMATCPTSTLVTHGPDVGLPAGQMGNSEVGHTNIGAGRIVAMDLGQIDLAIEDSSFFSNAAITAFIQTLTASGGTAHLMGVISDGGVHGHINHVLAACRMVAAAGVPVALHAVTDGRDVAPRSGAGFVADLEQRLPKGVAIATVSGRYYAMDRDNRWDRVQRAYDAMINGIGEHHEGRSAAQIVNDFYGSDITDEFLPPSVVGDYQGARDGDGFFCLNFRADRAREILLAVGEDDFAGFVRETRPHWAAILGLVDYSKTHDTFMAAAYPKRLVINTLGSWAAQQGKTQFRLAETEKYPHVTFFLNGGKEAAEIGEDRYMAPSPKVATYDLQPEMSAAEVTDQLVLAIEKPYDLIIVNYANPDMVGHTGDLAAAIKACEAVDHGLGRVLAALEKAGGAMVVTADHGNCETMVDPVTGGPHTAHTTNPVPVILVGGPAGASLREGRLADLAPTLLQLMQLDLPAEMTGRSLIKT